MDEIASECCVLLANISKEPDIIMDFPDNDPIKKILSISLNSVTTILSEILKKIMYRVSI